MVTKKRLIILLQSFVLLFVLSSCLTYVNSSDFEHTFNSKIGTTLNLPLYLHDGWKKTNESEDSFELEFTNPNGCSYAYKLHKVSEIIISWRFTSDRSKCDNFYIQGA